jgi:hypothetical protein
LVALRPTVRVLIGLPFATFPKNILLLSPMFGKLPAALAVVYSAITS